MPQTPAIQRDISLLLDKKITYTQIEGVIAAEKLPYKVTRYMTDRYEGAFLGKNKKSYTIHLAIQGKKTFKEAEIGRIMERFTNALQKKLGAKVRR